MAFSGTCTRAKGVACLSWCPPPLSPEGMCSTCIVNICSCCPFLAAVFSENYSTCDIVSKVVGLNPGSASSLRDHDSAR